MMRALPLTLLACAQPHPPTVDDPLAGGACTVAEAAACAPLEACAARDGSVDCACAAGWQGTPCVQSCEPDAPGAAAAAVRFIGPNGTTPGDCSGGTRQAPWGHVGDCVTPGMDVVLLAGDYVSRDVFEGSLDVSGESGAPVRILGDPDASEPYPARIRDQVFVVGRHVELSRLEIEQTPGDNGVMVLGQDITIRDAWVHGTGVRSGKDCIKILSQGELDGKEIRVTDILVEDTLIEDCPEDAIDVTGARGVVYRGNTIRRSRLMQVKGGSEDVLIENNTFEDVAFGVAGFSMACGNYCGSPVLPLLDVDRRFVARNVVVRNNHFRGVEIQAIVGSGWADARVVHNTFEDIEGTVVTLGRHGSQYYDEAAQQACAGATPCRPCRGTRPGCHAIDHPTRGFVFENNLVLDATDGGPPVVIEEGSEGVVFRNNLWAQDEGFVLHDVAHSLADFPPAEQDRTGGVDDARDAATDLGLCMDGQTDPRGPDPDVGWVEAP